ncbi:MAG: outer membrane protein assembly factor BamE [Novosphingobium sp.]|nr:outer membrane protein assembly factor BamE [Novosphingobium sp.]
MRDGMRMALKAGVLVALAGLAGACSSIRDHRGYMIDPTLVSSVQPGIDNKLSVERSLGRPTFVSEFGQQDWYYVSVNTKTPAFRRPRTYDQTVVRVRFDSAGNVASVDRRGMEKVVRLNPDDHYTPTLGRERSLLEDLFGNIGAVGAAGGVQGAGPGPNGS